MRETADGVPRRSAFAAAFLSLLFPGLGQAYGGASGRALLFAGPPVLLLALAGGLLANAGTRRTLIFSLLDTTVLIVLLAADVAILAYRLVAIIDAYRVTAVLNAWRRGADARLGRPRVRLHPLSLAGLVAVLLVASGVHAAVAYYDLTAYDLLQTITSGANGGGSLTSPSPTLEASATPGPTGAPTGAPTATPTGGRVNILLIGDDRRPGDTTFNTDTMIVVSIDPRTRQVAMFSLPRDVVNVPLPRAWPAYSYYGGTFPAKINSLWAYASGSPSLYPFPNSNRGAEALKGALGNLYGITIKWYVRVDFGGFRQVVDTLGGVTLRVDLPVMDDHYPQEFGRAPTRLYIPAGIEHMTGDQALAYARSRHGSNDFDRNARQQNVVLALRQETDIATVLAHLPELIATLKSAVHTDIPTSILPQLASLADYVGLDHVCSVVFSPPRYGREVYPDPKGRGYVILPNAAAIRQAVKQALSPSCP